jgi:streptogramin lyase
MFDIEYLKKGLALATGGCLATAGLMFGSPAGADTVGVITEYSAGMTVGARPLSIVTGPDGYLWFTEYDGNRIGRIDPATRTIAEFSSGIAAAAGPRGIAAGPDGSLWFTEHDVDQIGRINPATGAISEYSAGITGADLWGIAAGPDGNLWFAETIRDKIGRINPSTGAISEYSAGMTPGAGPLGIASGPDDNLWFTELYTDKIGRINPSTGTITEFDTGMAPGAEPIGITTGPDGSLWFAEYGGDRIGRITSGKDAPMVQPPVVTGSLRIGEPQQCAGERWDTWNGSQPATTLVTWSLDTQPIAGATGRTYTPGAAEVGKALTCTVQARYPLPTVVVKANSSPVTVLAAATPAASLTVKARKARKKIPKTGKATLVKKVIVGPGQTTKITVKVKPKKTKKKVKVTKTPAKVKVRTRQAPKGKVTVRITSSGAGFTPVTWTRAWKIR